MKMSAETHNPLELRRGWKYVPMGTVVREDRRAIEPDSSDAIRLPYVGLEDIESQTGVIRLRGYGTPPTSLTFAFNERHVLYGKLRPYLNKVALPNFEGRCSTEAIPLLPSREADRGFVAWFLRRQEVVARVMANKTGSRMPRADMAKLLAMPIPLPPRPEQRRIVRVLDDQIAAVGRARAAAERDRQTINDFERAAIHDVFGLRPLSIDVGHQAPQGWCWNLLTDVARLESGHTPSRRHLEWWGGDIPWLALPDIRALDGQTVADTLEKTNEAGLANSSARLLPEETVVLSRTASVGFVAVMGRPMATSQDFVNWVCGPKLLPWYLAYALIASRYFLLSLASGAIHKTIYVPTVKSLRICFPPSEEQRRIVAKIEALRKSVHMARASVGAQLEAIEKLPVVLLDAAFRGEL